MHINGFRARRRVRITEAIMLAHGFSIDLMVDLIDAGLATAQAGRAVAGRAHDRGRASADHGRWGGACSGELRKQ